jgi:hypothetical protein
MNARTCTRVPVANETDNKSATCDGIHTQAHALQSIEKSYANAADFRAKLTLRWASSTATLAFSAARMLFAWIFAQSSYLHGTHITSTQSASACMCCVCNNITWHHFESFLAVSECYSDLASFCDVPAHTFIHV